MKGKIGIAIAAGALASASAATATAQTTTLQPQTTTVQRTTTTVVQPGVVQQGEETAPMYLRQQVRAPRNAFELGIGVGYTQGFGDIQSGLGVGQVANAGLGVNLDLGYRASPMFSIGWSGQYQAFDADNSLVGGTNVRGASTSIQAGFHLAPFQRIDPFVMLGAGYRGLWIVPDGSDNNTFIHGLQLAKLQLGADVRVSPDVAIAPVIGADLNMFIWRNPEGSVGNVEIADKTVNTFIYAGLQGRFDMGGTREVRPGTAIGRR